MARNPMQDIVPRDGKSIRNIPVSQPRKTTLQPREVIKEVSKPISKKRERIEREIEEDDDLSTPIKIHRPKEVEDEHALEAVRKEFEAKTFEEEILQSNKKRNKIVVLFFALVAVAGLAVFASVFFKGATLNLTPRTASAEIQNEFTAKRSGGALQFSTIIVKEMGAETVSATGEKQVDKRASGVITIYNNYNATPQRLIKNTRFATPEGLIFRISDSVTVPGKKGTTPGSVEATVLADEVGEKYNVGLKDFTIPGFKGDPRYSAFYARSKTPLAGGFSGKQKIIADADRLKAKTTIEAKVTESLMGQLKAQVPEDRIAFEGTYKIEFNVLPEETVSGSEVTIKEEGVLSIVTFDRNELSSALAKAQVREYRDEPISVTNMDKLIFTPKGDFKPSSGESITFSLSGGADFEWIYDEVALKQALLGQPRSSAPTILQKFPTIDKADISLRPFWARKFPTSFEKIEIKKVNK